jgi:S-adenosylmethionine:tRNA ribosyltransferase-isomerase
VATGQAIEVRLAARPSPAVYEISDFSAVIFGEGDFHLRTEDRPLPPPLAPEDRLELGPLRATVERILDHPRLVTLHFDGSPVEIWEGLTRHGRPIQYSHLQDPLRLWDVWTPIAGPPVAFEPPSAGFALDWRALAAMRAGGIEFATITHAAGISSTGDPELDRRLPFDEPYRIPKSTALAVECARSRGGRVVAIGTTVVRALEHASDSPAGRLRAGDGVATGRIGPGSRLRVVDAILTGVHEPGAGHYELLRAFADDRTLARAGQELEAGNYRTHEFGDSVFIERAASDPELAFRA